MSAKARRDALQALLSGSRSCTQAELCTLLAERGHAATQSTVSRDLKRLGAQRSVGPDGVPVYRLGGGVPRRGLSGRMVLAIEHNECLVVLRTPAGMAPAVGLQLDALQTADILGTLAGDDTVLVVPRSITRIDALVRELRAAAGLPEA